MTLNNDMRTLIAAAGLEIQHSCDLCNHLLEAYGRDADAPGPGGGPWRCMECGGRVSRVEKGEQQ